MTALATSVRCACVSHQVRPAAGELHLAALDHGAPARIVVAHARAVLEYAGHGHRRPLLDIERDDDTQQEALKNALADRLRVGLGNVRVIAQAGAVVTTAGGLEALPALGVQVLSSRTAGQIRKMLQMAAGPGGTAQKAQTMGYSVGGKTGTAHKQEGKGYAGKKYRGFFVGMAPIESPRIVVAVMIDEPSNGRYFGGDVAAPVFSQTVQQTLRLMGVQPDMAVQPHIVAGAVEESF